LSLELEIQEAVGVLRQVTESNDSTKVIARLDLGEVELQFSNKQNLRERLLPFVGKKVGLLWLNAQNGKQVVKIQSFHKKGKTILTGTGPASSCEERI